MQTLKAEIPLPAASQSLTLQSLQERQNLNALKLARELAGKVLNSYPDYAKATPGFTAGIVEAFARYPESVQHAMADTTNGLRGRCEYLPTIAAVVKMADEITAEQARKADFNSRYCGVRRTYEAPQVSYSPFPQLAKVFDAEVLNKPFELLNTACRVLVLYGKEAALDVLTESKKKDKAA